MSVGIFKLLALYILMLICGVFTDSKLTVLWIWYDLLIYKFKGNYIKCIINYH